MGWTEQQPRVAGAHLFLPAVIRRVTRLDGDESPSAGRPDFSVRFEHSFDGRLRSTGHGSGCAC